MSLPDVNDSIAYTGRSGSAKRTLSEDATDSKESKDAEGVSGGVVKRTKSSEKVRYSYIDPQWEYDPETLDQRLSESNAKEAGMRDMDESIKRNSLGRKRKSWLTDHENEPAAEPVVTEVIKPDLDPKSDLEPHLEVDAAMSGDENPSKEDVAGIDDDLEDVVEQDDIVYETFLGAYGGNLQRMEESLRREKEGLLDELTGGITSSGRPRSRVVQCVGDKLQTDMSPVAGQPNRAESPTVDFYDINGKRPRHDGPGISPDAILAAMIMEKLSGQKPIRARVGRRVEDEQEFTGSKEYIPTLPYKTLKLPPDGPPHYSPRASGRGRGHPPGPYPYGQHPHGPYHYGQHPMPGERPTPAPRPQPQAQERSRPQRRTNAGPIIHGARPEGAPPPPPESLPPETELIPDPVLGAVSAAIESKNKNVPPDEYTGYYIETCVGVDGDFYNSPKKERLRTPKRDYSIDELAHRVKTGRSPESRAKSLERGLEEARREEYSTLQSIPDGYSTLERGRERERMNRARKSLIKDEGSQGSLDGSKERIKPAIAPKPKISDKLKQEFRHSSQERPQTHTTNEKPHQDSTQRSYMTASIDQGASLERKSTANRTVEMKVNSTVTTGTVQRTTIQKHEKNNISTAIEVVELSDNSSTGSSRPGSRPGSAGVSSLQSFDRPDDFMYNAMLQQSIKTAVSNHGATWSSPRNQSSSMDRSMTREQPSTANKQMKRSQTGSMDRSMARKAFFDLLSVQQEDKGNDEKNKDKGGHDRSSCHSSIVSKDSPKTPGTVDKASTPKGPVLTGTTPDNRSGPVLAGITPQPGKIAGGPVIVGHMPETAMQGSVERAVERKRDGRVATPLVVTKTLDNEKELIATVERSQDIKKDGRVATPLVLTELQQEQTRTDTHDKHFKKRTESSSAYNERVKKSEVSLSFNEQDTSDSFRTPNREYQYEMDVSSTPNDVSSSSYKMAGSASTDGNLGGKTPKSSSKDRTMKDSNNRKGQIKRDVSFDNSQFSVTTDRSDTSYGQDSMTDAVVRGAVRDTVQDNMFGQESTVSPVTPETQWSIMEDRFSTPKGKKEKKSKGGFFSFGSKRKPKRSRENSLDSTLDTTIDSTFDKRSLGSVGSQDTLNETVKRGNRSSFEKERPKDRTVKVKDQKRRVKEKEALNEVTNQDMDSIQDMYIEGNDDLLNKEDLERIGKVPMEMTSTPDRSRKVKVKTKANQKVEVIDLHENEQRHEERGRDRTMPSQHEHQNTEYTTTKDVMNAMLVGSTEGKKRSPRKKSKDRRDRLEEEERLHVTELSIDEMLKEREITRTTEDDDRHRLKEQKSSRSLKENSIDRGHHKKEHKSQTPKKDREDRYRKRNRTEDVKEEDRERTKKSVSRTRKDSEEERQIVKKSNSSTERSGRYVKKKDKEPSDATRAIMSELLLQVGASPGNGYSEVVVEEREEEEEAVVHRKVIKKRPGHSGERRRVKRSEDHTEEFEDRNGEASVQEDKRTERRRDRVNNGDKFKEYKVEWDEYPEDEFENKSFSGFDASLDEVIQERENRKSEVFRMLLEDTVFEKKLRRLAEKRQREMEKGAESGSDGTSSTPRSLDRSSGTSESLDELDLLRELEKRIEEYFERQKQKKIKVLLKKFMMEEGSRMSMLMSHTNEVLDLIALKDRELYGEIIEPKLPPAPEAEPPEYSRSVLYGSADVFEELDTEVIEIAQLEQASYIELVRDLTMKCRDELDRVRAIFRWITVKDLSKIRFDADEKINPESLLGMLKGIKEGKASYHDLFKRLCGYAGIHCQVIQGYSKGAGYRPGMKVEHKTFRNTWTAVNVNKSWRFVNCNWGARHYKHATAIKQDSGKDLCYKCDEFYFLTDPEDHIFQHFPDDKKWQLLRHPITIHDFMRLPVLKSPFFNAGLMKPQRKQEERIYTHDGRVEIAFKMRKFPGLHCTLELIEGKTVIPEPEGHSLIRIMGDEVLFLVTPPDIGRYFFNVYVAENWKSNSLEHAAAFLVIAGDDCFDNGSNCVFPSTGVIGKTPVMTDLGIDIPREQDPFITISCNTWTEVTLPFTLKRDVKLSHQMKLFNRQGKYIGDYDQYVFLKYKGSKSYCVRCPKEGVYALSVFAGDAKDGSPKLECIFKYLIACESAQVSPPPFPKPSRKWMGCTLHEPISGDLEVNSKYTFGVEVPDAVEVVVVIGDNWQSLEFSEHTEDLWEGKVNTGTKAGVTATVFVRYNEDSDKFSPILDYTMIDKHNKKGKA